MKKPLLSILAAACALGASAQLDGDGYYRIQNQTSTRYCYLLDNHGYVNTTGGSVDVTAVELFMDQEKFLSDPATIFYIHKVGSAYDLKGQGASIHDMVNEYITISYKEDPTTHEWAYYAYGKKSGSTIYLGDDNVTSADHAYMTGNAATTPKDYRKWNIIPVSETTDNYLGVKPTVSVEGGHYAPWYTGFPYQLSTGMEAYIVTKVDNLYGLAVYEPVSGGIIAEGTPVFIKCNSATVADNKVTVGASGASAVSGNLLKGVYYDQTRTMHESATYNDQATMRHLGVTSEGKLGYITTDDEICPHNYSYLTVSQDCPTELTLVTPEQYEEIINEEVFATGITLNLSEATVEVEAGFNLTATVTPAHTTNPDVVWTSADDNIATVSEAGRVIGRNEGVVVITATCQEVSATCTVTVVKRDQWITWDQEFGEVSEGDVITLTAENSTSMGVNYRLDKGEGTISGNVLTITGSGEYQVTAYRDGNFKYNPANEVTKIFNVTAGIASVLSDGISFDGTTIVNGLGAHIEVYNILGSKVYDGTDARIALRAGLYIVRTPAGTAKVKLQ